VVSVFLYGFVARKLRNSVFIFTEKIWIHLGKMWTEFDWLSISSILLVFMVASHQCDGLCWGSFTSM
jgi:hypothetical protein